MRMRDRALDIGLTMAAFFGAFYIRKDLLPSPPLSADGISSLTGIRLTIFRENLFFFLLIYTSRYSVCVLAGGYMQNNATELPVALPDALWLQDHFSNYANPKTKIGRLVRQGVLYRLKRGLYIKAADAQSPYILGKAANRIYGPSYVSFVYALRWHGLIPEHVVHITSATYKKGRSKRYHTPVGSFLYQDVPAGVYPHGVMFTGEGAHRFLIASAEKALCDELYRTSGVRSMGRLEHLLFEDLRLDPSAFNQLDHGALLLLAVHYKTASLGTLVKFVRKRFNA